ncbi:pumilio homolog 3-like [Branchiostoma floridae x Branchiostoma belcheri]
MTVTMEDTKREKKIKIKRTKGTAAGPPTKKVKSFNDQSQELAGGKLFKKGDQKGKGKKFKKDGKVKKSADGEGEEKTGQKRKLPEKKGKKRKSEGDGESGESPEKKQKLVEMKKKDRKEVRRQLKNNYPLLKRTKEIWEVVRRHDCKKETRAKLMTELYGLIKGRVKELANAHDSVRVMQCCIQFGTPEQRAMLFEELKDDLVNLSKSKYAKFSVRKLLKYGSKEQKAEIMKSFHGHIKKIIRHTEASSVLEYAYNEWANQTQRKAMLQELYGNTYLVFKAPDTTTLQDLFTLHPDKKQLVMKEFKESLTPLLEKTVVKHTIIHKALLEFFTHAEGPLRTEMIEAVRESLIHILHTHDGSRVTMHCLWHGTAKDRKVIIKTMKTFVQKICQEEFAHHTLLALFDVVDDTKLVSKAILQELLQSVADLVQDQHGRKVLLYLLCGRHHGHIHPDILKLLQQGDGNETSKKDPAMRRQELLEFVSAPLLKFFSQHTKDLVFDKAQSQVALATLEYAYGDKTAAYEALSLLAAEDFMPQGRDGEESEMHLVEHPAGHLFLKRLLTWDKTQREAGQTEGFFAPALLSHLEPGAMASWAKVNRGAFVIVSLLDTGIPEVVKRVQKELEPQKTMLKNIKVAGTDILVKKLETVSA